MKCCKVFRREHTKWIDSGYYQTFLGQMQQDGKGWAYNIYIIQKFDDATNLDIDYNIKFEIWFNCLVQKQVWSLNFLWRI